MILYTVSVRYRPIILRLCRLLSSGKDINYSIRRCCYIYQCATYTTLKELSNSDSVEISKRRKDIISATLRQLCANQINSIWTIFAVIFRVAFIRSIYCTLFTKQ